MQQRTLSAAQQWNIRIKNWQNRWRIHSLARQVILHGRPGKVPAETTPAKPVVFFNASTRIAGVSQNAAFAFLLSSSLQLAGVPVVHFACKSGLIRCVQGTNKDQPLQPMPCKACISLSAQLFGNGLSIPFTYPDKQEADAGLSELARRIENLSVAEMTELEHLFPPTGGTIPLGALVVPSLRWILRRHHLPDDDATRTLMREIILSTFFTAEQFHRLIKTVDPQAAVIFNGLFFPEAAACWVARAHGLRTITHEVGYQRFSAFFSDEDGGATAYPIHIPENYQLTPEQNSHLDTYLEARFQGQFTMAGIRFWPEMRGLDEALLRKMQEFRQVVPIFTNVVFDTSQVHANTVFPHMFAWLDLLLELIRRYPDTLFVIRAHPDEMRPGSRKQSRESVREWVQTNRVQDLPNVVFIDSQEYVSSYELIQKAKFVIVYNSSIGLEAALMGAPVLCGGRARYTQVPADTPHPVVFFPQSQKAFQDQAEDFLQAETISVPAEFQKNARIFLYFQLYKSSISFEQYLTASPRAGFVHLKKFHWQQLLPDGQTLSDGQSWSANSREMQILVEGILNKDINRSPFLNPDETRQVNDPIESSDESNE